MPGEQLYTKIGLTRDRGATSPTGRAHNCRTKYVGKPTPRLNYKTNTPAQLRAFRQFMLDQLPTGKQYREQLRAAVRDYDALMQREAAARPKSKKTGQSRGKGMEVDRRAHKTREVT